ncbi:hypothetical protein AKG98_1451 [Moritella sp. JT01]|uniref:hypothetical protein n=1 Tax=Moritella sp. JT01 TaxID=756698 RepID=UPI0007981866|nr:hypothetical protein [Moritella sp. JT01]KXO09235.1 hypothetical protein AKG98_1451 [Moritella sp. JT01]
MGITKSYSADELIYSKEETIIILKFIFQPVHHPLINELSISNTVRSFAQALLVEAVDASYAMGFIDILIKAIMPTKIRSTSISAILKKLGKNLQNIGSNMFPQAIYTN